eukprot:3082808-Rhodomonas_salina.2
MSGTDKACATRLLRHVRGQHGLCCYQVQAAAKSKRPPPRRKARYRTNHPKPIRVVAWCMPALGTAEQSHRETGQVTWSLARRLMLWKRCVLTRSRAQPTRAATRREREKLLGSTEDTER